MSDQRRGEPGCTRDWERGTDAGDGEPVRRGRHTHRRDACATGGRERYTPPMTVDEARSLMHEWVANPGPLTDRAQEMVKAFIGRQLKA